MAAVSRLWAPQISRRIYEEGDNTAILPGSAEAASVYRARSSPSIRSRWFRRNSSSPSVRESSRAYSCAPDAIAARDAARAEALVSDHLMRARHGQHLVVARWRSQGVDRAERLDAAVQAATPPDVVHTPARPMSAVDEYRGYSVGLPPHSRHLRLPPGMAGLGQTFAFGNVVVAPTNEPARGRGAGFGVCASSAASVRL
jgi:hypothetical protein